MKARLVRSAASGRRSRSGNAVVPKSNVPWQQKSSIAKENQRIAEEEQSRHTELKDKFQQAIKDVQEKMDAELEVRQHFLKENEELRGKLLKFTETYEAQEKQLAEQREARGREMEVAQQRLKEHESMCQESKIKTASLEKQNA